jgi:hypothetical protein
VQFTDVAGTAGVGDESGHSFGVSFADVNGDGEIDIYVTNDKSANKLYLGNGHGDFKDGTASSNLGDTGASRGAIFGDVNGDGHVDLYLLSASEANKLYINGGKGVFTDGTAAAKVGDTGMVSELESN